MSQNLASKAESLHRLHESFFVMPTIWDPVSALAAVDAGYAAVATSSAALGQGLGIKASERVPFDTVEAQVARIAAAVPVPTVVDMEDGYPEVTGGIDGSIRRLIAAGVVGVNIEDSWHGHARPLASAEDHARRLGEARRAADAELPHFFLNGRTDLFLQNPGVEAEVSLREAIRRAKLYVDAGADGIYVTLRGASAADIRELVSQIPAPLTLVAGEAQDLREWRALGVRRASLGTLLIRNSFAAIRRQLVAIRDDGRIEPAAAADIDAVISRARAAVAA